MATTTSYTQYQPGSFNSTSLHVGADAERASAKRRRQEGLRADLQLQMQENYAAKQRERLQDMSVNASGYLDPEKGPERFKPLGGIDWTQQRTREHNRVQPYHTLFLYDQQPRKQMIVHRSISPQPSMPVPVQMVPPVQMMPQTVAPPVQTVRWHGGHSYSPRVPNFDLPYRVSPRFVPSERPDLGKLDPPRAVHITQPKDLARPQTEPNYTYLQYTDTTRPYQDPRFQKAQSIQPINSYRAPCDQAYQIMAARDISIAPAAPLVQPLQPIHDTRPIIIQQPAPSYEWHGPKFNPITVDIPSKNSMLLLPHSKHRAAIDKPLDDLDFKLEEARLKIKLERDNDEHKRRLQRELDENQRRLRESEAEARRRLEDLRQESENRRREAERQRREWERLLRMKELERPRSIPAVKPPSGRNRLLDDMDLYRQKLREERRMIEELLMNRKPVEPPRLDIKVVRKQRQRAVERPPTPPTPDNANPENVHIFTDLKHRDYRSRQQFRSVFPEVPHTNYKLEWQQGALLKHQEEALRQLKDAKSDTQKQVIMKKYFFSRPIWMDREVTPFGRAKRRHNYTTSLWESEGRLAGIGEDNSLGFRSHRRNSADTLADDTWLRPSSADV